MEHEISQKSIGFDLFMKGSRKTRAEFCEDSKNSLAYFRAIHGHSGRIPIDPELMFFSKIGRGFFFTEVVPSAFSLSLRTD